MAAASYTAPEFQAPYFLPAFGATPRFGHTNDISLLIVGSNTETETDTGDMDSTTINARTDYIIGTTLLISILIIGITFLWLGVLLVLKCLGQRRVGWYSGSSTSSSHQEDEQLLDSNRYYPHRVEMMGVVAFDGGGGGGTTASSHSHSRTSGGSSGGGAPGVGVRVMVLLASVGMIICASVCCASGVDGFYKSFGIIRDGIDEINVMGANVTDLADKLVAEGNLAESIRDELQDIVNNGGICSVLGEDLNSQIDDQLQSLIDALDLLNDFTDTNIPTTSSSTTTEGEEGGGIAIVNGIQMANETMDHVLDIAEHYTWTARLLVIPMVICALWILIGGCLAWVIPQLAGGGGGVGSGGGLDEEYYCFQSWFAIPLTVVCILVACVLAAICGTALVMNSDLCSPPEDTVSDIIDGYTTLDERDMEFLNYYVLTGCQGNIAELVELESTIEEYQDVKTELITVRDAFKSEQNEYERLCLGCLETFQECPGAEGSLDDVGDALDDLYELSMKLDVSSNRILDLTSCERINGIYVDMIHDGVCTELPRAFYLVFVTLSLVSMFGLGMLTTRAGAFPAKEGNYLEMKPTASDDEFDDLNMRMSEQNDKSQYRSNEP